MENTFKLPVNIFNPGQFFACCGLMELAHALWPNITGWFSENCFHLLQTPEKINSVFDKLAQAEIKGTKDDLEIKEKKGAFNLRLDWWKTEASDLKTHSGQQNPVNIVRTLCLYVNDTITDSNPLEYRCRLVDNDNQRVEPFYLDALRFTHALDVGFSLDEQEQNIRASAAPLTELLAFIGLQRFRPQVIQAKEKFVYSSWETPLSVVAAAAIVCGAIKIVGTRHFEFQLKARDDKKRYKAFGFAKEIRRQYEPN